MINNIRLQLNGEYNCWKMDIELWAAAIQIIINNVEIYETS